MVTIVTLEEAKIQLEILNSDRDTQVTGWIAAATDHVCKILDDNNPPGSASIKQAVLLLIAEFDANRSTMIDANMQKNPLFMNLLQPYRKRIGV